MLLSALWSVLLPACTDAAKPDGPPADSGTQSNDTDPVADTDSAEDTEPPAPAALELGGFTPRNVIVINADTLRADTLPQWGSVRDPLAELRAGTNWASVARTVSTAPWTAPSTASLLTGEPAEVHGVRFYDQTGPNYPLAVPDFASYLQGLGVATALLTGSNVVTNPAWSLTQGFDYVERVDDEPGNAAALVLNAEAWLDTLEPEQPFLLFLQPMDMHGPYRAEDADSWTYAEPEDAFFDLEGGQAAQYAEIEAALVGVEDAERSVILATLRKIYDEQALGLGRAVSALVDDLERRGLDDDTLLVFTSDHGETFDDGDVEYLAHSGFPRHEVVTIPLMFGGPAVPEATAPCLASNMDVFPTIVQAMGLPPMGFTTGASLLDGCRDHAFSALYTSDGGVQTLHAVSVESLEAQVVFDCADGRKRAFDLVEDPTAVRVVSLADAPGGEELGEALTAHLAEILAMFPDLTCTVAD